LTASLLAASALLLALLLTPPLLWLGVVYLGSLAALLLQSFYSIDEFSGVVKQEFTLKTYGELLRPSNFDILVRTVTMAAAGDAGLRRAGLPHRLLRRPLRQGALEGRLLPGRHAAPVVELSGQGLCLEADPGQGRHHRLGGGATHTSWIIDGLLSIPGLEGSSLSTSPLGTFMVFVYIWLPYMILPMQARLERVPNSMLEASADLGATPAQTFRT
jgi:putative spermidine/putrescine transport system permease protein